MINFKVFLRNDENVDVRRFTVDDSVVTNFLFMKEKIITTFPLLRSAAFKITWKDSDEDEITIVNDEDLITAFTDMEEPIKVLYVTITDQQNQDHEPEEPLIMGRVVCDACDKHITNFRYKCMQCPDYDLCSDCEQKGLHSNHIMIRLCQQDLPRCVPKLMSFLSRSMRKESHRASKHCFKAAKEAAKGSKCHRQQSTNSEKKNECPMDGIIYDFAAPFMEALHSQTRPQPSTSNNANGAGDNSNSDLLENILRLVSSVFVPKPSTENASDNIGNPPTNEQAASVVTPPTSTTTLPKPTETIIIPASTQPEIPIMEMDIEQPKQPCIYPSINESHRKEKPSEADWTFVSQQQSQQQPQPKLSLEETKIQEGLGHLSEMGFSKHLNLEELLRRFNGNVGHVVRHLFENNIE